MRQTGRRRAARARRAAGEIGGAFGDLGTFLPHVLGALTLGGLAPVGVLAGFGAVFLASGLFYALPMAVQPMKAVSAVLLTGGLSPAEVAATGIVTGLVLVVLGLTGWIAWLARLVPQSVTTGLQLGLGLSLAWLALGLLGESWWLGLASLAVLALALYRKLPGGALLALGVGLVLAFAAGEAAPPAMPEFAPALPQLVAPSWPEVVRAIEVGVLPQLPLTLTNAIIVTALVARDLFPQKAGRANERNLSLTSGFANLLLCPWGALPMCHGAGGLQAQYRFGARSGWAPAVFGLLLLVLGLGFSGSATAILASLPLAAVGALLLVAGLDLAASRRLFDARANCWPAIGVAAALTLAVNPAAGLIGGWLVEALRTAWGRAPLRQR